MKDLSTVQHFPASEKLVEILCRKTQNMNPLFYRVQVAYYFAKCASMMRCDIDSPDRGVIPVNIYAINLASSGQGKGHSTNIIEEQVINQFREVFLEDTFPVIAEKKLSGIAVQRAIRKGVDDEEELVRVNAEFKSLGSLPFSFDSGTTAAVKQMRHKLLMADAGSMNMEIDEIGSNLLSNIDVMAAFLELYDVGKIKQKLVKNTAENIRSEDIEGRTPTNMLLYGTPSKLFNGGRTEEEMLSLFEAGMGRRCLFGYNKDAKKVSSLTPTEIYDMMTNTTTDQFVSDLSDHIASLADVVNFGKRLVVEKAVALQCIEYRLDCEKRAESLGDHDEIRKAELSHRYFKALKLAGAYAFIEDDYQITEDHLWSAIKLVEESGAALDSLLTRDKNYVKLAKYLAKATEEVTHADLAEDLPFFKGSASAKSDMLNLAIAYGYKRNIVIKKSYNNNIEFLSGDSLTETNLDEMIVSSSGDIAKNYQASRVKWDDLQKFGQVDGYHWANHCFLEEHRKEEKAIAGFNILALDIDEGVDMSTAQLLLKDYEYIMYTTKRHQKTEGGIKYGDRFRILIPMNYELKLSAKEYREFMENVQQWLPFGSDDATFQRSRKWETNNGTVVTNAGKMIDVLPFIPKTAKNEERKKALVDQASLSNVERWFMNNTGTGNRSNQFIRYAYMLVDAGQDLAAVQDSVLALNNKLADKMDEAEIMKTIIQSAAKAIAQRDV